MSLRAAAVATLRDDPRFPTPAILRHWCAGATKQQIIGVIAYPEWPVVALWWLTEDEQRRIRQRARVLAALAEQAKDEAVTEQEKKSQ